MKHVLMLSLVGISLFIFSCKQDQSLFNIDDAKHVKSINGLNNLDCGNEDAASHFITLDYAYSMINNFQEAVKRPNGLCDIIGEGGSWVYAETFPRESVQLILDQAGCCRFRIYYGLDRDNRMHQIMVGVTSKGEDILYAKKAGTTNPDSDNDPNKLPLIVEIGVPCPEACGGVYVQ